MPKIKIPKSARVAAKKALKDRDKFKKKPLTRSGLTTAKQLSNNFLKKDRINKAFSFLSRSIAQQKKNFSKKRQVGINAWGGRSMLSYLNKIKKKNDI